jgi:CheY-like chemotaxis protein
MVIEATSLVGKRVLVVEDELLIAYLIEDYLTDVGCDTAGPFDSVAEALEAVRSEAFDAAVLDVNLVGERSYAVADALAEQGIPFLFLSGYGDAGLPPGLRTGRICAKPFKGDDLTGMLAAIL